MEEDLTFKDVISGLQAFSNAIDQEARQNRSRWAMVNRLREHLTKAAEAETFLGEAKVDRSAEGYSGKRTEDRDREATR
jgi:hypothetical protein